MERNGNSRANFAIASMAFVASTPGRACDAFRVDVVTRQTCRHSPSTFARTRQTRERRVWRVICKFSEFGESGEFGECRLDRFIHIQYVFVHKTTYLIMCTLASTRVLMYLWDSPDSLTFAKPCCADSPDSPTFAKPFGADSPNLQTMSVSTRVSPRK